MAKRHKKKTKRVSSGSIDPFEHAHPYQGKLIPPADKAKYATMDQAADVIGKTRMTIHRWIKSGLVKTKKHGRFVLVVRESLTPERKSS